MGPRVARALAVLLAIGVVGLGVLLSREDPAPYVITAIDYHFHDAHPTLPLEPGQELVISNAGRNRHNVTIPALDYSRNVRPDERLVVGDVAALLGGPGRYPLVCRIHEDRGMVGTIVVAG